MNVNLKSLIGRLNDTCRGALEGAAGLCMSRTNYDVEIEHILAKLLEADDTDFKKIMTHFEINPDRMTKDVESALKGFFDSQTAEFYRAGIHALPGRWKETVNANGNYF